MPLRSFGAVHQPRIVDLSQMPLVKCTHKTCRSLSALEKVVPDDISILSIVTKLSAGSSREL